MSPHDRSIPRAVLAAMLMSMFTVAALADFKEGDNLPDLASFQLEGKLPEELKGQVILLDFWASCCGPGKSSFPAMETLTIEHTGHGLTNIRCSGPEKWGE